MVYKVGIVGAGHWSERLYAGISGSSFDVYKTADVLSYKDKKGLLKKLNIKKENHYTVNKGESLPNSFFDGLDVVQIASPIEFHRDQTLESLKRGIATITEKSYGANRKEFYDVLDYIDSENLWNLSLLHLHYLNKLPTLEMPDIIRRATKKYGPIKKIDATFIEEKNEEDKRRGWLFEPKNGGIFLDWIHPLEVIVSIGGRLTELFESDIYKVEPEYSDYPTAAKAKYRVQGDVFDKNSKAVIHVGKGFQETQKKMKLFFDGAKIEFEYADSEKELESDYRGKWIWRTKDKIIEEKKPKGPNPYEFLIQEIRELLEKENIKFDKKTIENTYSPVWTFNESVDMENPIDGEKAKEFEEKTISKVQKCKYI